MAYISFLLLDNSICFNKWLHSFFVVSNIKSALTKQGSLLYSFPLPSFEYLNLQPSSSILFNTYISRLKSLSSILIIAFNCLNNSFNL